MRDFILRVLRKAVGYDDLKKRLKKEEDKNAELRKYLKKIKNTVENYKSMNAYSENIEEGKTRNYLLGLNKIEEDIKIYELKEDLENDGCFVDKIIDTDSLIEDFMSVS